MPAKDWGMLLRSNIPLTRKFSALWSCVIHRKAANKDFYSSSRYRKLFFEDIDSWLPWCSSISRRPWKVAMMTVPVLAFQFSVPRISCLFLALFLGLLFPGLSSLFSNFCFALLRLIYQNINISKTLNLLNKLPFLNFWYSSIRFFSSFSLLILSSSYKKT